MKKTVPRRRAINEVSMKRINKKARLKLIIGAGCACAIAAAVLLLFTGTKTPGEKFARLLSENGSENKKPNVVFITLDTTRADRLGCYGYKDVKTPYLDFIAQQGVLFETCISASCLTLPSHSSMMTGLYPTYHGVRVNGNAALSQRHQTLAEQLSDKGYNCGAFIAAFVLDGRWGLKQGFHHYDDSFDLKKHKRLDLGRVQRPGNQVMDSAIQWMEKQKDGPFFSWIHLYDPHTPYEPPEPYRSLYQNGKLSGLYDGEIAFTDSLVGRCITWLTKNGLDKNTIFVVMGDHGEGLGDHGELTHGYYIYDYALHVPFLLKTPFPQLQGRRVSGPVRTVDLYPTLLDMLDIPIPAETQGKSLLPAMFGAPLPAGTYAYGESMTPHLQYGWSPLYSLHDRQFKYIDAPRPELFDLSKDPKELNNLTRRYPDMVKKYKGILEQLIDETSEGAPEPETANLDGETMRRLATLGYTGGQVKQVASRTRGLADPKDKFKIFEKISLASEYMNHERHKEAAEALEWVLNDDPAIPQARLLLSTCYVESGQKDDAKAQLDVVLKEDPNHLQALIAMANILSNEGNNDDMIALCQKAISVDANNTQAYTLIGEVFMGEKNHEKAHYYLDKAVNIQPKLTRNRQNLAACLVGLQRYDEARNMLDGIIEETPKFPLAHFHLGLLFEERGNLGDALRAYGDELSSYPECVPARFNMGKLLLRTGDCAGYNQEMKKITQLAPEMPEGYLFLARGLLKENAEPENILGLINNGLTRAKTSKLKALGYFLMADVYTRRNQPAKVKKALERAMFFKKKVTP